MLIAEDFKSPTINKYVLNQQICFKATMLLFKFNLKIPNSNLKSEI